ncbi:hypothetical protein [Spongiactinospora sp. 9N601]|uniref:hypothetical protein n=1 Tax=Spongiactinospora sp. 9N601 TaxID=3375149 RepID=UPI0037956278
MEEGAPLPVRVRPYKATFDLDAAMLRRVRVWAAERGLIGVAPVVRALIAELGEDGELARAVRAAVAVPAAPPADAVKTTFDLDPPTYRALKVWAAGHGTTGTAVLRALLAALVAGKDGPLARRIAGLAATGR